jgi:hypothetical protein
MEVATTAAPRALLATELALAALNANSKMTTEAGKVAIVGLQIHAHSFL